MIEDLPLATPETHPLQMHSLLTENHLLSGQGQVLPQENHPLSEMSPLETRTFEKGSLVKHLIATDLLGRHHFVMEQEIHPFATEHPGTHPSEMDPPEIHPFGKGHPGSLHSKATQETETRHSQNGNLHLQTFLEIRAENHHSLIASPIRLEAKVQISFVIPWRGADRRNRLLRHHLSEVAGARQIENLHLGLGHQGSLPLVRAEQNWADRETRLLVAQEVCP
jgi:hypothetical protein